MKHYKANVGLVSGNDRRANVLNAMNLVSDDLLSRVRGQVLIKPNFLSSTNQLASSHVDALRGVLDFLMTADAPPSEIIVAEGANEKYSGEAFANFGYEDVIAEYPVPIRLVDLHQETEWTETPIYLTNGSQSAIRMPRLVLNSPCTISLAVAKTHDTCVVTLALKNMIMGTLHKQDRVKMHGCLTHGDRSLPDEARLLNLNLALLARHLAPDIAVIDGTRGLQGNGPGGEDGIDFGVVDASADAYAADAVMTKAMGFDPDLLAQSSYGRTLGLGVSDLRQIKIVGADLERVTMRFKPHEKTEQQLHWADEAMSRLLAA